MAGKGRQISKEANGVETSQNLGGRKISPVKKGSKGRVNSNLQIRSKGNDETQKAEEEEKRAVLVHGEDKVAARINYMSDGILEQRRNDHGSGQIVKPIRTYKRRFKNNVGQYGSNIGMGMDNCAQKNISLLLI